MRKNTFFNLKHLIALGLLTQLSFGQQLEFEEVLLPVDGVSEFPGIKSGSFSLADIDNDNDLDIIIAGSGNTSDILKLYKNDGAGIFTEVLDTPFEGWIVQGSTTFLDIDNDSDLLITGLDSSYSGVSKLYTNDGTGIFTEVLDTPFEGVEQSSVSVSDIDNDGDQDLIITGRANDLTAISKLYTNDGTGIFIEVPDTPFQAVVQGSTAFSDIDNDGDQDLMITGHYGGFNVISRLYTNDGSGIFTEVPNTPFESVSSEISFSDIDNDGDQDVLITSGSGGVRKTKLYINDGSGVFTEVLDMPFDGVVSASISFLDGDQDVMISGNNNSQERVTKLYKNVSVGLEVSSVSLSSSLEVYPNPTQDSFLIKSSLEIDHISILDFTGKVVLEQKGRIENSVDVSSLSRGVYFIRIASDKNSVLKKIILN